MEYAEYFKELIGLKIKEVRLEYDITQKDLAKMIGTSQARLASYEKGTVMPSNEVLSKIAPALDKNVGFFCNDTGMLEKEETPTGDLYRFLYMDIYQFDSKAKNHEKIEDIYKNLDEENKKVILQFAKLLLAGQNNGQILEDNLKALKYELRNYDISTNSNTIKKILYDDRVSASASKDLKQKQKIKQ